MFVTLLENREVVMMGSDQGLLSRLVYCSISRTGESQIAQLNGYFTDPESIIGDETASTAEISDRLQVFGLFAGS